MSNLTLTIAGATLADLVAQAVAFINAASPGQAGNTPPVNYGPTVTIPPQGGNDDNDGPADQNAPTLDKQGIPWDERIHSSSKKLGVDGTWNRRRNTPDATWNSVMAELAARRGSGQAGNAPPAMMTQPPGVGAAPAPQFTPPQVMQPPGVGGPAPQFTPPPVQQPQGMTFERLMPILSNAMQAGRFTPEQLAAWQQQWSIQEIGHLMNDPAKCDQFYNWLKQGNVVD